MSSVVESALDAPIDWEAFARIAQSHAVVPLAYRSLCAHRARVPASLLARWRGSYLQNMATTHALICRLIDVVALCEEAGILCVPFKGPILAADLYGDVADRSAGDLDVFVHRSDVRQVASLLLARGFEMHVPNGCDDDGASSPSGYHCTLEKDDAVVELHWDIAPRFLLDMSGKDDWWQRVESVPMRGRSLPSFAREDQLLLLCVHGSKHVWDRYQWICDIAMLLQRTPGLDVDLVLERARERGCERMVLLGLMLARSLLGAPLPPAIEERVARDRVMPYLAGAVRSSLREPGVAALAVAPRFFLLLQTKARDRVRLLLHLLLGKVAPRVSPVG